VGFPAGPQSSPVPARILPVANQAPHKTEGLPRRLVPSLFLSNSRSLVNKIDELSGTVSNLLADIIVITETWLTSNVDSAVINLSGFSIFRRDREDGRRGLGRVRLSEKLSTCSPFEGSPEH
jgi:hypothetical protein